MEEEKFTDGFKGEGEMLERGGGAHLSSHSHIPGASASSGPPPVGDDQPHGGYVRRRPRQTEIDVHGSKLF